MVDIAEILKIAVQDHGAGRLEQAEKLYQQILQTAPNHPAALHSLATIALQRGRYDAAIEWGGKAIKARPEIPQFYNTIGVALKKTGKLQKAADACKQAISLKSDYVEAYYNLATILQAQGRTDEAIENYEQVIRLKPDIAEIYYNLGIILNEQGRHAEAIENYKHAVRLKPDFAKAYYNLANVLRAQGWQVEAIENYRRALHLKPDYAEVYNGMGLAFKDQSRLIEAIESYNHAIRLKPDYADAYANRGLALKVLGHLDDAVENYKQAIRLKPNCAQAHWNMSLAYLLIGEFEKGWKEFEWRYDPTLKFIVDPQYDKTHLWDGSSFAGKRLLVHYEQGFGDSIQFVRYLPMVKALGGTVIYEERRSLLSLLSKCEGIDDLVETAPNKKPDVDFDFHIPLLSLAEIFGTTLETIPADVPYVHADPTNARHWREYFNDSHFKVGIVWAGRSLYNNNYTRRSCALQKFAQLARIDGVCLYSLQKDSASEQLTDFPGVIDIGSRLGDFGDTAAVIDNLDLVISIDTAVAHLAGAMGKPVWTLLPFTADWRWLVDRSDSPWYPTMRLFRQQRPGDWDGVLRRVAEQLQIHAKKQMVEC